MSLKNTHILGMIIATHLLQFLGCMGNSLCTTGFPNTDYVLLGRYVGYEEREYPSTVWVKMTTTGFSLKQARMEMYPKLYKYFQGQNFEALKMIMPTLSRMSVEPGQKFGDWITFTLSYKIPFSSARLAPAPIDKSLVIEEEPPTSYYVRSFYGKTSPMEWLSEGHELAKQVRMDPSVDKSKYHIVLQTCHHCIFKILGEIWFARNQEPWADGQEAEEEATETPVTAVTETPVTAVTETPVTAVPVTSTTEEPVTSTTEMPVTSATEEPVTSTTEVPVTETNHMPDHPTPEDGEFDVLVWRDYHPGLPYLQNKYTRLNIDRMKYGMVEIK